MARIRGAPPAPAATAAGLGGAGDAAGPAAGGGFGGEAGDGGLWAGGDGEGGAAWGGCFGAGSSCCLGVDASESESELMICSMRSADFKFALRENSHHVRRSDAVQQPMNRKDDRTNRMPRDFASVCRSRRVMAESAALSSLFMSIDVISDSELARLIKGLD